MADKKTVPTFDRDSVVITCKGAAIAGEPQEGLYYGVRGKQPAVDKKAACAALKALYPKSFFSPAP